MTAYYNEIDPYAAQWLRNLIDAGEIAPGVVDETDIRDVKPDDLREFTQCHFFAGVGVWSRALRESNWPDDRPVWTGSCPCQPFSAAGRRDGTVDERHLWPHFFHLITQRRPSVIFGEQVASKDGLGWLDIVQTDLEGAGYTSGAVDLCAAGVGAPHIRQRLWFVAERLEHPQLQHQRPARQHAEGSGDAVGPSEVSRLGDSDNYRPQGRIPRRAHEEREAINGSIGCNCADSRPGPTNGLWRDADWLSCRDGKWRPVEPKPQQMVDGSAESLGRLCSGHVVEIEEEVIEWSLRYQTDPGKALYDVRASLSKITERGWETGRLPSLHEAPFLLAFMRQLSEQRWAFSECLPSTGSEASQIQLRMLWNQCEASCAPHRRGLDQRTGGEHTDALRVLSSILARHASEAWGTPHRTYAATGFPLASAAHARVGRLRAYGNAINLEAAKAFIGAYQC